jgi:hypothetical protein
MAMLTRFPRVPNIARMITLLGVPETGAVTASRPTSAQNRLATTTTASACPGRGGSLAGNWCVVAQLGDWIRTCFGAGAVIAGSFGPILDGIPAAIHLFDGHSMLASPRPSSRTTRCALLTGISLSCPCCSPCSAGASHTAHPGCDPENADRTLEATNHSFRSTIGAWDAGEASATAALPVAGSY